MPAHIGLWKQLHECLAHYLADSRNSMLTRVRCFVVKFPKIILIRDSFGGHLSSIFSPDFRVNVTYMILGTSL